MEISPAVGHKLRDGCSIIRCLDNVVLTMIWMQGQNTENIRSGETFNRGEDYGLRRVSRGNVQPSVENLRTEIRGHCRARYQDPDERRHQAQRRYMEAGRRNKGSRHSRLSLLSLDRSDWPDQARRSVHGSM